MISKDKIFEAANQLIVNGEISNESVENNIEFLTLDKYFNKMFLDIDIKLPAESSREDSKVVLIGLSLLRYPGFEIVEDLPLNSYQLVIQDKNGEEFCLDYIKDVDQFNMDNLRFLIQIFAIALKDRKLDDLDNLLTNKVYAFNNNKIIIQERIFQLSRLHSLPQITEITGLSEHKLRIILDDREARINLHKFNNLLLFEERIKEIKSGLPNNEHNAKWIDILLLAILNGGADIHVIDDLLPNSLGMYNGIFLS